MLTFDVQFDVIGFAHSKLVFGRTTVESCSVFCDGTEDDFFFGTENTIEAFFPPQNGGRWIGVHFTPQGHRILFVLKIFEWRRFNFDSWWV